MAKKSSSTSEKTAYRHVNAVPIEHIFLSLHNPRHDPVDKESEAIDHLCNKEDVLPLARDIVRHGLSPLERFALSPIGKTKSGSPTYYVEEGNRRICALKLLADPELAPPKMRKAFERLAENWKPIGSIDAAVFDNVDTLRVWLDRVHSGPQGGIGRLNWDSEQKQRFFGGAKNKLAQTILDYAENEKMITKQDREGKLTTAQRFLNPEVMREMIGIDRSNPGELARTRPKEDFDVMLRQFMKDLVAGEDVTSRKNKADIVKYARALGSLPGVSSSRIEPEPLSTPPSPAGIRRSRRTPRKPDKARHVRFEDEISRALKGLGNEKLESLYYSICALELDRHTPIVSIGCWAFFETLTACQGRSDGNSFDSYLSKGRLSQMGFVSDTQSIRAAISRMREYGNSTKHHPISATFNGDQLNNDMTTLKAVILRCIEAAPKQ